MTDDPLLSVRNLKRHYPITSGVLNREVGRVRAVDGVDFDVERGEVFGLVGESGCGKSTLARTVLRLEEPTAGSIRFDGEDVTAYDGAALRSFRRRVGMVFQDPDASLDPRMSVGESVAEPLRVQGMTDRERRRRIVADLFERVDLAPADARRYPHEFSGGQKQRIALARALAVNPDLLIADEPASALDVSTTAEILRLLADLQSDLGMSVLLISHDISVVERICDRVAVMYLGAFAEVGPTESVLADPQHPYTEALIAAVPTLDPRDRGTSVELAGEVPSASDPPAGCRFHTRCPKVVQPAGYDLDQGAWRRVIDLRRRLREDGDAVVEAVRRALDDDGGNGDGDGGGDGDGDEDDNDGVSAAGEASPAAREAVRAALDLPASLGDSDVDAVLADAIDHLLDGDADGARDVLAAALATPCERRVPEFWTRGEDHRAACHLHADDPHEPGTGSGRSANADGRERSDRDT